MATRLRKVRRLRGSRTHGWGQVAQHRRTGAKGGSGMAGLHKHKFSYMVKYDPEHFGSNKWHPPHPSVTTKWANVGDLPNICEGKKEVDLGQLGYDKLLGKGRVTEAFKVKVPRASAPAIEKVKAVGGQVEVESGEADNAEAEPSTSKNESKSEKPSQPRPNAAVGKTEKT